MKCLFIKLTRAAFALAVFVAAATLVPAQDGSDTFQIDKMLGPGSSIGVGKDGKIKISKNEGGDVTQVLARKSVHLVTTDFTMDCDVLTYNAAGNKLVAVGTTTPVKIRAKQLNADCSTFEYYPAEKKAVLSGNPVVHQKSADGNAADITGSRIIVTQTADGGQDVEIESAQRATISTIDSKPAPTKNPATMVIKNPKPASTAPKKAPAKAVEVDEKTIDKIPETSSGE
jgi:lipopolysaccharide export system protein LptA